MGQKRVFAFPDEQANRRVIYAVFAENVIYCCDVCSYLTDVSGVEFSHLYLDYDIASEIEVVEKEVNEFFLLADLTSVFFTDIRKAGAQFKESRIIFQQVAEKFHVAYYNDRPCND